MLSKQFCRRVTERSSRYMATLVATEEFALTPQSASQIRPAPVITESTVTKGVKILSRYSGAPMTTLKFAIRGGSRAETLSEKGAAHMLSITAFAGTQRVSGLRLIRDLETMGAQISSSADREKILYEVTVPTEMADDAMARVAEAIASPPSAAYVINDLKGRGQIDYDNYKESPNQQIKEMLHEAAYGEGSPLGNSTFAISLSKLSAEDVMSYRQHTYNGNNVTVTSNGGVNHEELTRMVDNYFVRLPGGPSEPVAPAPASPYVGGDYKLRTDLNGQTFLALGFPLPKGLAVRSIVADRDGGITPFYYTFTDGGLFGFYTRGEAEQATDLLLNVIAELKSVAAGKIDVEPHKFQMSLGGKITLDGENAAELLLLSSMTGVKAKEFTDMSTVTKEEVQAAAIATLKEVPSYAVLGTTAGTHSYTAICKVISA